MMSLQKASTILGGSLSGTDATFQSVSIDSRQIKKDALFIAIKGDNFDGHDYLTQAIDCGASAVIVERHVEQQPNIRVDDCVKALGTLAKSYRSQLSMPIVALTGSNGKTTLKELIASILSEKGHVYKTQGNLNNHLGLPLSLLGIAEDMSSAVLEMGMNHSGEIAYLSDIAKPNVVVINNAMAAHLEGLGSLENIVKAKGEIIDGLKDDGVAVLNADDNGFEYWLQRAGSRKIISFGFEKTANVQVLDYQSSDQGLSVQLSTDIGDIDVQSVLHGRHNVMNIAAAIATARALDSDQKSIVDGVANMKAVPGRLDISQLGSNITLIDDSYNANPGSVIAAAQMLSARTEQQKIFVLGDMAELGSQSDAMHHEVGQQIKQAGINYLFALGRSSELTVSGFGDHGMAFNHLDALVNHLQVMLEKAAQGSVAVLVKGSRSMKMERVINALKETIRT